MKETEGEGKRDRDCPSWHSLLGAGSVFGSAQCIISISPNLPEQMEKRPTCSTSCIIKSLASVAACAVLYCTHCLGYSTACTPGSTSKQKRIVTVNSHTVSLGASVRHVYKHTVYGHSAASDQYKHWMCFIRVTVSPQSLSLSVPKEFVFAIMQTTLIISTH